MKSKLIQYSLELVGALVGSLTGFLYWKFVGCASGSCAITSDPINSSVYGAIIGALVFGLFKKETQTKNTQNEKSGRADQIW